MDGKQSNKDRIKQITDGIERGIKELFESDRYCSYLKTMSRFHSYSVNNTLLIHTQCPHATLVAGFSRWKNQFGRHVKKGEKGIQILAPTPYLKKIEEIKRDPVTQEPVMDENGEAVKEEKTVKIPAFKVVSVFDVSQTEGKPLPSLASGLNGAVEQYDLLLEALHCTSTVPIRFLPLSEGMDGYFSLDSQSITIREGMSQTQTISAIIHEMAHSRLHNYRPATDHAESPGEKDRNTEEVEAESISYVVCQYLGIETGENSFGYIAAWSKGKELKELRESLETINKTSSELIAEIEQHYESLTKEREASLEATEQVQPASSEETVHPDAVKEQQEITVADVGVPDSGKMSEPIGSPQTLSAFGYTTPGMLPVSVDFALELLDKDVPIYMLGSDNTEWMAFDREDIANHRGMLGVTKEDWENIQGSPDILALRERFLVSYSKNKEADMPKKHRESALAAKLKSYPIQPRKNASRKKHKEQER